MTVVKRSALSGLYLKGGRGDALAQNLF